MGRLIISHLKAWSLGPLKLGPLLTIHQTLRFRLDIYWPLVILTGRHRRTKIRRSYALDELWHPNQRP